MKEILNRLFAHQTLSQSEARGALLGIGQGQYNAAQMTAFLTVYVMRNITVAELEGFRDAMLELCLAVDLADFDPMDVCGTGGDGKDTFNISTLASLVVAGAGQAVAKHGNYGVSSLCGSSTVMEHLGYRFTSDADALRRQMQRANICFLHAPLFHPAMKHVGGIRKELGVKTFFNMLGPMVNPAAPQKQLVGVFSLELARLYAYLYQQSGKQFAILHALDGYDEISLTGDFKLIANDHERVLRPQDLGLDKCLPAQLTGGESVAASARIFVDVLAGAGTVAQNQAVLANAAVALQCARPGLSLPDAVALARESLESGRAMACFKQLMDN